MSSSTMEILPWTLRMWLVMAAVSILLIALLLPQPKWASSGTVTIPVEIHVFDVHSAKPIEGAIVSIIWSPPANGEFELHEYQERLSSGFLAIKETGMKTNDAGIAVIQQELKTGANHERPTSHAHTRWYWLLVTADDYGGVAVPLRYESLPTQELKEMESLPAYVGLTSSIPD